MTWAQRPMRAGRVALALALLGALVAGPAATAVPAGSFDGEELAPLLSSEDADQVEPARPPVPIFPPDDPPILAHYYIWFLPSSWNRAKRDFPLLGRYSSDDTDIMRQHIRLAQSAGIDGFIVSWKSTDALDARLDSLVEVAEEMEFHLALTYQALDFNRDPLPVNRIGEDLDRFIDRWGQSEAFELFGRPMVTWTGTEQFGVEEIERVTGPRRSDLLILASEKSVEGYERVADTVDGNLYYWSSVNVETFPGYPDKLVEMGQAVRDRGGVWIAPVAPGFDARMVGGTSVVSRRDGQTLRDQWNGAVRSNPTAIGIISWNEFSENTQVEPSQEYQSTALEVLANLTGAPNFTALDFDSNAPQAPPSSAAPRIGVLVLLVVLVMGATVLVGRRQGSRLTADQ